MSGDSSDRSCSVALVGYGYGGSVFHAPFIAYEDRLRLAAVVTSDPKRAADIATRYPLAEVLRSVDELERRGASYDVVVISTPNATHVPIAMRMLAAGVRTLVIDKPVAPSAAGVESLMSAADVAGSTVIPFQNRRYDGDFMTVEAILGSGELGRLVRFESRYERWQPQLPVDPRLAWKRDPSREAAAGVSFDLGSHLVDQAVVSFGAPSAVYAEMAAARSGAETDDDCFVALEYPGGPSVHLWASLIAAERGPRFRLLGTAGAFTKYGMDTQVTDLLRGRSPGDVGWGCEPASSWGVITVGEESRRVPTLRGAYQRFYAGVADTALQGSPPTIALADALTTALVLDAAVQSARSGEVEPLRP